MTLPTEGSRRPYARLSPEDKAQVIAELKRLHESGALGTLPAQVVGDHQEGTSDRSEAGRSSKEPGQEF